MKVIGGCAIALLILVSSSWAQEGPNANDVVARMKTQLDLQEDQVTNITPIIEKYAIAFADLQKSIDDGTINPSAVDSQRQGIEAQETQELATYLKPYQLSEWRQMQSQMDQGKGQDSGEATSDSDQYSNLPKNNSPQN